MNPVLSPENAFGLANGVALCCWIALVALPRRERVLGAIRWVVGALCIAYAALIGAFFFSSDGGFSSLAAVQALFRSSEVALAGWIHYLAFDLLIGLAVASRCDRAGISRVLQAPVLVTIFASGPIGVLLAAALLRRPPGSFAMESAAWR